MKSNGKNITIPSNREKFYLKITKAHEKLENGLIALKIL